MMAQFNRYFSADYSAARSRFVAAAGERGAVHHALPLDARAPDGSSLSIDIAWIGAAAPRRVVVHSSGLHGVEGFAGSAIQLALLAEKLEVPADGAFILVHVLNPFGMAWLRRVNESNVDLNRNFLGSDVYRADAPQTYRRLDAFLNPPGVPGTDLFYLRAAWQVLRHGLGPLQQAIAGGQYAYPKGLFFGGERLEQGPALYLDWIRRIQSTHGASIDVHTGLGRWCEESVFVRRGAAYQVRGGYEGVFEHLEALTQEFGTYSALRVLAALRDENRWHHYGGGSLDHPAKARLKEMFAPRSESWRAFVVERGLALAKATAARVFAITARA